jgi:lipid A 3-O-deacylase
VRFFGKLWPFSSNKIMLYKKIFVALFSSCALLVAEPCSHLLMGAGLFDMDKTHPQPLIQLEYRWDIDFRRIRPLAGFFVAAEGNCFFYGGVGVDIYLGRKVILTPSFAPGFYYAGNGKSLGFPVNFRSAIDLCYESSNRARWGIQLNHISNAGMLWKNPGANSLVFFYSLPFKSKVISNIKK